MPFKQQPPTKLTALRSWTILSLQRLEWDAGSENVRTPHWSLQPWLDLSHELAASSYIYISCYIMISFCESLKLSKFDHFAKPIWLLTLWRISSFQLQLPSPSSAAAQANIDLVCCIGGHSALHIAAGTRHLEVPWKAQKMVSGRFKKSINVLSCLGWFLVMLRTILGCFSFLLFFFKVTFWTVYQDIKYKVFCMILHFFQWSCWVSLGWVCWCLD